jgi:chemotaxis protein methyltransferase CheR
MSVALALDDYVAFCHGVRALCRIDLLQYKREQMERRIRAFAERRGAAGLPEYLRLVRADPAELDALLDRLTINVSQLWRNPEQWAALGALVLPELAAAGAIRAWSAGCSYGAEAYTLAAVAAVAAPGARIRVRGTDVDARMVARAREGRFSDEDARDAPRAALLRAFDRDGTGWRAKPELRARTTFDQGDLLTLRTPPASLDLILCRNTVIYFTDEVRDALHGRLALALRPGGVLMVGATERIPEPARHGLEPAGPFLYRRS